MKNLKTIFTREGKGKLLLESPYSNSHLNEEFMFELRSLINWYPLDNSYDYIYYPRTDCITLVRLAGVDGFNLRRKSYMQEGDNLDYLEWNCPSVARENQRVSDIAHDLHLKTFADAYSSSDASRGLTQVSKLIDELTAKITIDYRTEAKKKDSHYPNYDMLKQEEIALKQVDKKTSELYILLGELYNMYRVMGKVTEKNGATRLF